MVSLCTRAYRAIAQAISGCDCVKAKGRPDYRSNCELLEGRVLLSTGSVTGSNTTDVTIPDNGSSFVSSQITISNAPAGATVTGIDVYFKAIHAYEGDLNIDINADAQGTLGNYDLWSREGGSADNPTRTKTGIATFNGLAANRTWYLYARDESVGDSGRIDEWSITVYYSTGASNSAPNQPTFNSVPPNAKLYPYTSSGTPDDTNGPYTVTVDYTDPNGASDLQNVYLQLAGSGASQTLMYYGMTTVSQWAGEGDYLYNISASKTAITNGYRVTWNFQIKSTWTPSTNVDFKAWSVDKGSLEPTPRTYDWNGIYDNNLKIADARLTNLVDNDGDGYYSSVTVQADADTSVTSRSVDLMLYRRDSAAANAGGFVWDSGSYTTSGVTTDWKGTAVTVSSRGTYDFGWELYDPTWFITTRWYDVDGDVSNIKMEPAAEDVVQALSLTITPTTTQTKDWGESVTYTVTVRDANGNPVSGANVPVEDPWLLQSIIPGTTNASGQLTYTANITSILANGTYNLNFTANKTGFTSGLTVQRQVQVNHVIQTLALTITPSAIQTKDWGQSVTYTVTVRDAVGNAVSGASVAVVDPWQLQSVVPGTTNASGQWTYTANISSLLANGTYNLNFTATRTGFNSSPTVQRQVQVNHTGAVTALNFRSGRTSSDPIITSVYSGQTVYVTANAIGMAGQQISVQVREDDGVTDELIATVPVMIDSTGYGESPWWATWQGDDSLAPFNMYYLYFDVPNSSTDVYSGSPNTGNFLVRPPQANSITGSATDWAFAPLGSTTPVTLTRIDSSAPIITTGRTWIVIHGRNSASNDNDFMSYLAQSIDINSGADQVLTLDWHVGAQGNSFFGEKWIAPVANWAAAVLASYGISGSSINLVGHSWGGVMCSELSADIPGGVSRIVALDPAEDARPVIQLGTNYSTDTANFSAHSGYSWAFYSEAPYPSAWTDWTGFNPGNEETPTTAKEAYCVLNSSHSDVVRLFANMLSLTGNVSSLFHLDRLLNATKLTSLKLDQFSSGGTSGGNYEAVIDNLSSGMPPFYITYVTTSNQNVTIFESAPEIVVTGNSVSIMDGGTSPIFADWTNFGSVPQHGTAITRTFRVTNTGQDALITSGLSVPLGYLVTEPLNDWIAAGQYDDFSVDLNTGIAGSKSGQISFATNDSDENPFNFSVTGVVTASSNPQLVVSPTNISAVPEGGSSSFTVKLSAQPASNVVVSVARTSGDADLSATPATLTFTSANWSLAQPVTVAAAQDADTTNGTATFTVSATGLTSVPVTATESDDDIAVPAITVSVSPTSVTEDGAAKLVYTFTRSIVSASAMTVNFTVGGTATYNTDYTQNGAASFSSSSGSVIIAANQTTATVTVDPVADSTVELDDTVTLTVIAVAGYTAGSPAVATGTISNDDTVVLPTMTLVASDPNASEVGPDNGQFTVSRTGSTTAALTVNYTISGTASNGADYNSLSGSVTIPVGQLSATITVTPVTDASPEGSETVLLSLTANAAYTIGSPNNATVTISDNALPPNSPPTISVIADRTINEDSSTVSVPFTIGDAETAADSLLVGAASSDTSKISLDNVSIVGGGTNLTFNASPAANQNGQVTITLTVTDGGGASTSRSFLITINPANDAPSFTASIPPAVNQNAGAQSIPNWAIFSPGPANESGQTVLVYTVSNISNPSLFAAAPSISGDGTLTYTPASGASGTSTFQVSVRDNGGTANGGADTSASQSFTITVTPPGNRAPTVMNVSKSVNQDASLAFVSANFTAAFADPDTGNTLQKIRITSLPTSGTLKLGATAVTLNQEIAVGSISTLTYTPATGYTGSDSFGWNGSDGSLYAVSGAVVNLTVTGSTSTAISFAAKVDYGVGSVPFSVAVGDFNGDGKSDLAVANYSSDTVSILVGKGDGTFQAKVDYAVGSGTISVAVGDFNGDGKVDLAVANAVSDTVSILLGKGDGTFQAKVNYGVGSGPHTVALGDFNGDGKSDLAVANYGTRGLDSTASILQGNGDGTFQSKVDYGVGGYPISVAVGDFNGDGKSDLAVANDTSDTVSILQGNGNGTFQSKVDYAVGSGPSSVAVGDFNGDGKSDLAMANWSSDTVSILVGKGDGTFQTKVDYGVGGCPLSVAVGDFNGDGKIDLAVANGVSDTVSILRGNGDGTFQAKADYGAGTEPGSVSVGDFNGDGKSDLAVANIGSNTVSILLAVTPIAPRQIPLVINGTAGNDQIIVSLNGGVIVSRVNGVKTRTPLDQIASITVNAGAGNDTVLINPGVMGVLISGGRGNDTLTGGDGNDTIKGQGGNDLIHGGLGNDLIQGGAGDDTLYGDAGNDTLNGGAGRDLMYGGAGADTFLAKDAQADTIFGGAGADTATVDDLLDIRSSILTLLV